MIIWLANVMFLVIAKLDIRQKQRRRDHKKASEKMAKDQGSGLPKNNMKKVISDKSIVAHRGRTSVDIRGRAAIDVRSVISTGTIQEE
jgi:hypothetical protein